MISWGNWNLFLHMFQIVPPPLFFVGDYDAWLLYIFAESRLIHRETLIVLTIPPNYLRAV